MHSPKIFLLIILAYKIARASQMPYPALKILSMRQDNTQIDSLGVCWEVGTSDDDGKVEQERMADADAAKVTAKKSRKNRQMQTKTRLTKKRVRKIMHFSELIGPPVYL